MITRESAKKLLPIIKAYSEGKEIEYFDSTKGEWDLITDPMFDAEPSKYRIKIEPKYRPFKNADECLEEIQKHQPIGWIKNDNGTYFTLTFIDNTTDLEYQFNRYKFVDGEPFGIKEEE